jgi:hypothetical protein
VASSASSNKKVSSSQIRVSLGKLIFRTSNF